MDPVNEEGRPHALPSSQNSFLKPQSVFTTSLPSISISNDPARSSGRPPRPASRTSRISQKSFFSDSSDAGEEEEDEEERPPHLAVFSEEVDTNSVEALSSIGLLAFLDAQRQPCCIIPLPQPVLSSSASISSTGSSQYDSIAGNSIWGNMTFFAVTRGKQITSCLGPEEAKYFLRWIYGPEFFVQTDASEGVEGEIGYYQGVDLALSPTLIVTLHPGTSAPTTLEFCRTTSPSTPHLILTSHIISDRPTTIPFTSNARSRHSVPPTPDLPSLSSVEVASPTPSPHPTASSLLAATPTLPTSPPLFSSISPPKTPAPTPRPPQPKNAESMSTPELDAKKREMDRLFEVRSREITLLTEWAPVGMFCGTPDGLLTYVNKQFRELTGLQANPNSWPNVFCPADRTPLRQMWEECFRTGKQGSGEFQLTAGHHVLIRLVGLTEGKGNSNENSFVTGFVGTMIDISDRKDYEAAQKKMIADRIEAWKDRVRDTEARRLEIEESKKQQELLVDITSHEIRNPTSAIIAASELLRSNINDLLGRVTLNESLIFTSESVATLEDDILVLDSIQQSATIQERLSNDILRLAQIDLELLQVFPVKFDIVKDTRRLLRIFTIEASQKGIELVIHIGPSFHFLGHLVEADPVRLNQITMNLISNAVKFTQSSATKLIEVTVNISLVGPPTPESDPAFDPATLNAPLTQELVNGRHDGYIFVEVKDSGGGISLEDQGHLFQRFKQGNAEVHTAVGGSGLGLFVCKELTRLQGGRIDLVSNLGKPTTFRFFIAAGLYPPVSGLEGSSSPMQRSHSDDVEPDTILSVLVVEDNEVNRKVLVRQFSRLLWHVEYAENGKVALDILSRHGRSSQRSFDVVLMDTEMPIMDGLTALREIRSMEARGDLPGHQVCLSVTGNARKGQIEAVKEAGADDCVTKPYAFAALCVKIRELVSSQPDPPPERRPMLARTSSSVATTSSVTSTSNVVIPNSEGSSRAMGSSFSNASTKGDSHT